VTQSLRSDSYSLAAFLQELETVLQRFITAHTAPVHTQLSAEFVTALRAPITVDSKGCLCVALQDSPFHRLLLHAVCQYYGLHSKSVSSSSSSSSSDKGKTMRIKPLAKTALKITGSSSSSSGMSLCEFVCCTKVRQSKHDRENRAALATYANSAAPTATATTSSNSNSFSKSRSANASVSAVNDLTRSAARILIRAS
jgi:hypothetical protein